jgi:hypothetical protein
MMNKSRFPVLLLSSILLAAHGLSAENIRGLVVDEVTVGAETGFEATSALRLEEMVSVSLAENSRYLKAVHMEILLSNTLKKYFDSFGLVIYKNVSPLPQRGGRAFQGERIFFHYLPYLNRIYVTVPTLPVSGQEPAPAVGSFRLAEPVLPEEFPLLVSVIPLMKGIPNSIQDKQFFLTMRPVLVRKGLVQLALQYPPGSAGEALEVTIDGQPVEGFDEPLELESGIHSLVIRSEAFKEVNATFAIESGQTSKVDIILEEMAITLTLEAPQEAEVYLDGEKVDNHSQTAYPLDPGSHLVRIKIGEYSISKKFTAKPGKNYHISCVFDIIINED